MFRLGRWAESGVCVVSLAGVLAGCGGTTHVQKKKPTAKAQIAQACKTHASAVGTIAGAITDFKLYEDYGNPRLASSLSPLVTKLTPAIAELKLASGAAASSQVGERFFRSLNNLAGAIQTPPTEPVAYIGNQSAKGWTEEAAAAGCSLTAATTGRPETVTVQETVTQQTTTTGPTNGYPASFSDAFVRSCEANADAATCGCALSYLESHSSPAQALAAFTAGGAAGRKLITGALQNCENE